MSQEDEQQHQTTTVKKEDEQQHQTITVKIEDEQQHQTTAVKKEDEGHQPQTTTSRGQKPKPNRPRRIVNPTNVEEMFLMMETLDKKLIETKKASQSKLKNREDKRKKFAALSKVYVSNSTELEFLSTITEFKGHVHISCIVPNKDIEMFQSSRPELEVTRNVVIIED